MYEFIEDFSAAEFDEFIKKYDNAPVFQTRAWATVKSGWQSVLLAVKNESGVCAATMMLIRRVAPGFCFAYCPRGYLMDFKNRELLEFMTENVRKYAKNHGICYVKIDPPIVRECTMTELSKAAYINPYTGDGSDEFENLIFCDYMHKGYTMALEDCIQPRFNMVVPLFNAKNEPLSADALKNNYRKSIRKYMGQYADNRGFILETPEITDDVLEDFTRLIHATEQRQGIYLRGKDYFKTLCDAFGDRAKIVFAKADISVFRKYLCGRLEKEPENADKINSQIVEADEVASKRGTVVRLAALLIILPPNETGLKTAEYLYAGSDLSVFSDFNITLYALYNSMQSCICNGIQLFNLGGVEGTLDDGLYLFKSKFNALLVEYHGEFDLVVNKTKYNILEKELPNAVRLYKKTVRFFKKGETR